MILPSELCCERMKQDLRNICHQNPNRFDCPDSLIAHSPNSDSHGITVHDGGQSAIRIAVCPFCRARLRDLSERLFEELDSLDPDWERETVPGKYRTAEWWREKGL